MRCILFFLVVLALLYWYSMSGEQRISIEEAKKSDARFVDVRTDIEWNLGHLPNAIHGTKFLTDKDEMYILYCNTGQRARLEAERLRDRGFKNVRYISSSYVSLL